MSLAKPVSVRRAEPGDAGTLAGLFTELGYGCSEGEVASRLGQMDRDRDQILVAVADGRCVGAACLHLMRVLHTDELWCRLTALVVTESCRGCGVGSALLEQVERFALAAGAARLELTCNERRDRAHLFYARHGFHERRKRFVKALKPPASPPQK